MLTMALRNMPNLRDVVLQSRTKNGMSSSELTTSRRFSMVLSSMAFSGVKLKSLTVAYP
jgi:hypothetical protein